MEKINDSVRKFAEKVLIKYFNEPQEYQLEIAEPMILTKEILQLIYDSIEKAWETGCTILKKFQKEFMPIMQDAGLTNITNEQIEVIYATYMQLRYAYNTYQSDKQLADKYPYWKYNQIQRNGKNNEHAKFDGKVFRHDDPIWYYLFPPSYYGCACWVSPLEESNQVENGIDYLDSVKANKYFSISPIRDWEPKVMEDVNEINKQLENMLKNK